MARELRERGINEFFHVMNRAGGSKLMFDDSEHYVPDTRHRFMARVFDIDVLVCPRYQSRMQLISFVHDLKVARDILRSLKMTTAPPDVCEPNDYAVEYDRDQVRYTDEEEAPSFGDF